MYSRLGAIAFALAAPAVDISTAASPMLSRGLRFTPERRYLNRGTGDGVQRAIEREERKRAWQRRFYAQLDGRRSAA